MKIESVIKDSLENDAVLFVSPPEKYKDFLEKIISLYFKKKNKLCLVSLNKSYDDLSQELKKQKIDPDKILFIDCVSKSKGKIKERDNVFYVSSPKAFTEISIAIKEAFKAGVEDVIFDSLSTPFIHTNPSVIFKFAQDLIKFTKKNEKNVFFTLKKDDFDNKAIKQIRTLVDKITLLGEKISPAKEVAVKDSENILSKFESVIQKSLEDVVLFVSPSEIYKDFFKKIISVYLMKKNKLCVISLNQTYDDFSQELKRKQINSNKILFIDSVSKSEGKAEEKKNVVYISSSGAFTEISIAIKKALKAGVEDVIFDSLSTPFIYTNPSVIFKFAQDLITFVKKNEKNVFFTLKKDDFDNKAIKQIRTLVDKITLLGEKVSLAKEDAIELMENLFGPNAAELVDKKYAKEVKSELLLKDFKNTLSELVGPSNAGKQMEELYEEYARGK